MGLEITYEDGQTPLSEEEKDGLLIKTITVHGELDEYEQLNIEKAIEWTIKTKFKKDQILTEEFIKKLHRKMLGDVWKWAGSFRKSDKNLGIHWSQIGVELKYLLDDTNFWIINETYAPEEISKRFKHRLVSIHCFPNGNGRHSRIMADILMEHIFKKKVFTWQQSNIAKANDIRKTYINALKKADNGDIQPLIAFAV
uniref:mobile mystery protein B n=1 Tax=Gelidibacter sp. TaxID=2018083 RepID=UPI0040491AEB